MLKEFTSSFRTYSEVYMALVTYDLIPWCTRFAEAVRRIACCDPSPSDVLHLEVYCEAQQVVAELRAADEIVVSARAPIAGDDDRSCVFIPDRFQAVCDQPEPLPGPTVFLKDSGVPPAFEKLPNTKIGGQLYLFDGVNVFQAHSGELL